MSDPLQHASAGRSGSLSSSSTAGNENQWVSRFSVGSNGPDSQTEVMRLVPDAEVFGGFRLVERINQPANGEVWRAIRPDGQCVKLHCIDLSRPNVALEIRALNLMLPVRHPHLVSIFGPWERAGWVAVGMDLADGSLLDQFEAARRAGQAGLEAGKLVDYMSHAARGIDFLNKPKPAATGAGQAGLIHCRIQPAHLLVFGEVLRVGDFDGVQRFEADQNSDSQLISAQFAYPATGYSAPELFRGQISLWSDQYSLAASYYHLRSGRQPTPSFGNNDSLDISRLPVMERPILQRALSADPLQRWSNCQEFVEALRGVVRPVVSIPTRNSLATQEAFLIDLSPPSEDLPALTTPILDWKKPVDDSVQRPVATPLRIILATESISATLGELDSAASGFTEKSPLVDSASPVPNSETLDPTHEKLDVAESIPVESETPIVSPILDETDLAVAGLPLTSAWLADEPYALTANPATRPNRPRRFLMPLAGVAAVILLGTIWFEMRWTVPLLRSQANVNPQKTIQTLRNDPRQVQENPEEIKSSPTLVEVPRSSFGANPELARTGPAPTRPLAQFVIPPTETPRLETEVVQKRIEPDLMIAKQTTNSSAATVAESIEKEVVPATRSLESPTPELPTSPVPIATNLPVIPPPDSARITKIEQDRIAEVEKAKSLKIEQARIAKIEQDRIVEQARIAKIEQDRIVEQARIAKIEQDRIVEIEKAKSLKIEQARIAKIEQDRIVEVEKAKSLKIEQDRIVEQARIAKIEQDRIAEVEKAKSLKIEQARIAKIEQDRIVEIEKAKSLKIEQARIAKIEQDRIVEQARIAKIEQDKIAKIEQDRIADVEKARIAKIEQGYTLAEIKTATQLWGESTRELLTGKARQLLTEGRNWSQTHPLPTPANEVTLTPKVTSPVPPKPKTATILVRMPVTEAELVVRGAVGRGNPEEWYGADRVIHSPPFTTAQEYLVGSFWTERDGRQSTRTQKLRVEPGHKYEVDLRTDPPSARDLPDGDDQ